MNPKHMAWAAIAVFIALFWWMLLHGIGLALEIRGEPIPAEYAHEPQFYVVRFVSEERLQELCPSCEGTVVGWTPGAAVIYINEQLSASDAEQVLRHEQAHLNGWRH